MKDIVYKAAICVLTVIIMLAFAACSNPDTDEGNASETINAKLPK